MKNDLLVTFLLMTYNQEEYVGEALEGALAQDYSNLEIIISDDFSSDGTYGIIESLVSQYSGCHKVAVNRNKKNLGLAAHFNLLTAKSSGDIIVVASGDDISMSNRVSKTVSMFNNEPSATIVSFKNWIIDSLGRDLYRPCSRSIDCDLKISLGDYLGGSAVQLSGASRGFKKSLYTEFGDLNNSCPTEDTPYLLRGLYLGCALVSSDCCVKYRRHSNNISGCTQINSMNFLEIKNQYIADLHKAISLGLLNNKELIKINYWIDKNYRQRIARKRINESYCKIYHSLLNIFNNDFSFKERISILKKSIIS